MVGAMLTCISDSPTATYSGMMPGVLAGQFDADEATIDLNRLTAAAGAELLVGRVTGLDLDQGCVEIAGRPPVPFDALSIGIGSVPAGLELVAGCQNVVPVKPMRSFAERLDRAVHPGDRLAIVGGGVASVELALTLDHWLRRRGRPDVRLQLLAGGPEIAGGMSRPAVETLHRLMRQRQVDVQTGRAVVQVGDRHVTLDDQTRLPADAVIWATGAAGAPVLSRLGLATDSRGFLVTDDALRSISDPRVFAVGDCGTVRGSEYAKAGVYAVRQAPVLWHNLRATASGDPMRSFEPQRDFLKILNTGDGKALLQRGPVVVHRRWCLHLKQWIDQRFMRAFRFGRGSPGSTRWGQAAGREPSGPGRSSRQRRRVQSPG